MFTYLVVIIRIFSNSFANLFQKKCSQTVDSLNVNLYSYLVMSLICVVPALFIDWTAYSISFWGYVLLAGLLCTVGTIALIEALKIGELSELAPINSYKSVVGLISAVILLGEIPTLRELVAVLLIVVGSYIVLDNNEHKFSLKTFWRKDIRLRFFALFCTGIEASILKKIILMSNFKISLILWSFSGLLCSYICKLIVRPQKEYITKSNWYNFGLIAVLLLIMQLSTNYVFSKMDVGISFALFQLSSIFALILGCRVFKEQNIVKKFIGTIIMIVGSTMIIL